MVYYEKSPIVEAVCEFKLELRRKITEEIVSEIHNLVISDFPTRKLQTVITEVQTGQAQEEKSHVLEENEFHLFEGENFSVRLQQDTVSIHVLKPYPSWEIFRPKIHKIYDAVNSCAEIVGIKRIGLLYVDHIVFDEDNIQLMDYINFYPTYVPGFPKDLLNFSVSVDFSYENGRDMCSVKLFGVPPAKEAPLSLMLVTDYSLVKPDAISLAGVPNWLEHAHAESGKIFESCITDKAREMFRGGVE